MKSAVTFMKLIHTRDCANIYYKQPHVNKITLYIDANCSFKNRLNNTPKTECYTSREDLKIKDLLLAT